MNTRANIMFFIEQLLDMATKEGHDNYVKMIQRDIIRIVEAVAPEHRTGAANVGILRLVGHFYLTARSLHFIFVLRVLENIQLFVVFDALAL